MSNKEKALSSDKLYQKDFINRFEEFKFEGSSEPWVIELDPTTVCNLACHGCICEFIKTGGFKRDRIKE